MAFLGALLSTIIFLALPTAELRVDEANARLAIERGETRLSFPIDNDSHAEVSVSLEIEILDPKGAVVSQGKRVLLLRPGRTAANVRVEPSIAGLDPAEGSQLLYYRARYRLAPSSAASEILPLEGAISVSELTADLFELEVVYPEYARAGRSYRVIVAARHPATDLPVAGVRLDGTLSDDAKDLGRASATTDAKGIGVVDLPLPGAVEGRDATLRVRASKGPVSLEKEDKVFVYRAGTPLLTTDKSLYQPGQTLHMRLLSLDASRRAIEGASATFKVTDEEDRLVFAAEATTSRFGIAFVDWPIPESTRLGSYRVHAELDSERWGSSGASKEVRVSRYDVPQFVVEAAPDRPFYLPGERARVEVRAEYLFGEAVTGGRVRIARAEKRYWDYRRGTWAAEGRQEWTGELDSTGRFVVEIDLSRDQEELESSRWRYFDDLDFQAYVTDASTGRTEERRFDVRISRDPVHVYWIDGPAPASPAAPFDFYLSTFLADGSPLECNVTVHALGEDDRPGPVLATVQTSRYGVAKIERFALPPASRSGRWGEVDLVLVALDAQGRVGRRTEEVWTDDWPRIDVRMDRTLHRPEEKIEARLDAPPELSRLAIFLTRGDEVLRALLVTPKDGRAEVEIPYEPSFRGSLSLVAFPVDEGNVGMGSHPVVFPFDDELRVSIETDRKGYRPGELAQVRFDVRRPDGTSIESALGVTVVDRALLERERTDEEFGNSPSERYWRNWRDHESLGSVSKRDIELLDPPRFPDGMDLVAEILFRDSYFYPGVAATERYRKDVPAIFEEVVTAELAPLAAALEELYRNGAHPRSLEELEADLARVQVRRDFIDPWEHPFRAELSPEGAFFVLALTSDGPDEKAGTGDDFVPFRRSWNHFGLAGRALDRAVMAYHARTGLFIRDHATLREELLKEGVDIETLLDPWGRKYRFELGVETTFHVVRIYSGESRVWTGRIDYFAEIRERIRALLDERLKATGTWPDDPGSLEAFLERSGASLAKERDPWGRPYTVTFSTEMTFADRLEIQGRDSAPARGRRTVTPVTRRLSTIHVRSAGPDDSEGSSFEIARFQRVVSESEQANYPSVARTDRVPSRDRGAIGGTVTDGEGGVLPGVSVTLSLDALSTWKATTESNGEYLFQDIREGTYTILFELVGFKKLTIEGVPVRLGERTIADAKLSLASVAETVTVTGESPAVETRSSAVASSKSSRGPLEATRSIMTPRLRRYFPETLWWEPELTTDEEGRAQLTLPLADNVTTWSLAAVASNVEGEIGLGEADILAFQPFFIDLDPPAALTVGDRIQQPVLLRSYLEEPLQAEIDLADEPWFRLQGERRRVDSIPAGGTKRFLFDLEAISANDAGRLRVAALSNETPDGNDAVEKTLRIRPDGREMVTIDSRLLDEDGARFEIEIPQEAVDGSVRGEVRIYPNLIAHVLEGLDAVQRRPYGCTEQTISAAYPGLLLLRYHRDHGGEVPGIAGAQRMLSLAYQTLLTRQSPDGGFSYWGRTSPDVSLTAYAVGFLEEARAFLEVDEGVEAKASQWLRAQQNENGGWVDRYRYPDSGSRDALVTAVVTRVLVEKGGPDMARALDFLSERSEEIDEPYLLAAFALSAHAAGQDERAQHAADRLRSLARPEGTGAYWHLKTNTPFYGWGRAGRLETTALATLALARIGGGARNALLVDQGLAFLLQNKDRFGGWHSTQATMRVIETLLELLPKESVSSSRSNTSLELFVNGELRDRIPLPPASEVRGPIHRDLSPWLGHGANEVRLGSERAVSAAAEVVSSHYRAWPSDTAESAESADLRFSVRYRGLESRVGEEIEARVEVERVGFRGYGMLLAEVGVPPGADVDRPSLEDALSQTRGWQGYEVLPDRVVFYLWPRAGGAQFAFRFRPRFPMEAKGRPSRLYDYYNPDSELALAPPTFRVR